MEKTLKPATLHLITPAKNASPFDVNMAIDAGFAHIVPYTQIESHEVIALTQDAIFSRSPSGVKREALFFGGRDVLLALQMQQSAQSAMFPPFEMSSLADPSGAFTTAAAMLAKVESALKAQNTALAGKHVLIFGAGGPVGTTAALIAANQGAQVHMAAHRNIPAMQAYVAKLNAQFGLSLQALDGSSDAAKTEICKHAQVILCAAAAGVRVLTGAHLAQASQLQVVADVNAVAPSGIENVVAQANGDALFGQIAAFGALAIGQLKYQTQHHMLKSLLTAEKPAHLAHTQAFEFARQLA